MLIFIKKEDIEDEIYVSKDNSLIKFIRKNFELEGQVCKTEYHNNIDTLEKLDNRTINTGLARMEKINHDNEMGALPIFITLFVFMFTFMGTHYKDGIMKDYPEWGPFIGLIVIIGAALCITFKINKTIKETRKNKMTANYFSILLKGIKEDKKNMDNKRSV